MFGYSLNALDNIQFLQYIWSLLHTIKLYLYIFSFTLWTALYYRTYGISYTKPKG